MVFSGCVGVGGNTIENPVGKGVVTKPEKNITKTVQK